MKTLRNILICPAIGGVITASSLILSCGQDFQFAGVDANTPVDDAGSASDATATTTSSQQNQEPDENSSEDNFNLIQTSYNYGQLNPPIDYLFIIDNSSSMELIIDKVNQGFNSLQEAGVFPPESLVAVMNTMIADDSDYSIPSPFVTTYTGIAMEPGFLDFVDSAAIENYKTQVPGYAGKWPLDGCNTKWFQPQEKNANGDYCLEAATQSTFSSLGVEAGTHAFAQLLLKNAGQRLFRTNALLNVIFVSDTHDPGLNSNELKEALPNYNALYNASIVNNTLASLKFHALAPFTACTGEQLHDQSYFNLVEASGGQKADSCNVANYQTFLANMVDASKTAEPKFLLQYPAETIIKVLVNDEEIIDYEFSDDEMFIILNGLDPTVPVEVTITHALPKETENTN